jgi:hypothetical protein
MKENQSRWVVTVALLTAVVTGSAQTIEFTSLNRKQGFPALLEHRVLRPDLISTQGPMLFEVEFCAASRIDFDGAHAVRIVGRA